MVPSVPKLMARECRSLMMRRSSLFSAPETILRPRRPEHLSSRPLGLVGLSKQFYQGSTRIAAAQTNDHGNASYTLPAPPKTQRMILTDAMALLYRSHFAFGPDHRLRNSKGEDTTVVFGFLSTLLSLLELQPPPTHVVVVFDASGKTFRHELFRGYKGQRPETPEQVREAVPRIKSILETLGIPQLCVPGVEADDVIGTLAVRGVENGMAVAIASPDKDFFQLLRPGLILLRPPKKSESAMMGAANKYSLLPYTQDDFSRDWDGLKPAQFVDVLALMGDASDNVPGVSGIGPKTATKLLLQYGTLEQVLAHAGELAPKRASAALLSVQGIGAARLSKQLVQIQSNLDLPPLSANVSLDQFRILPPPDGGAAAVGALRDLEFKVHEARLISLWQAMSQQAQPMY